MGGEGDAEAGEVGGSGAEWLKSNRQAKSIIRVQQKHRSLFPPVVGLRRGNASFNSPLSPFYSPALASFVLGSPVLPPPPLGSLQRRGCRERGSISPFHFAKLDTCFVVEVGKVCHVLNRSRGIQVWCTSHGEMANGRRSVGSYCCSKGPKSCLRFPFLLGY